MTRRKNATAERWKRIPFAPEYRVSDHGRVFSLRREQLLAPRANTGGYYQVQICDQGTIKACYIHRLVMATFRPHARRPDQRFVNHRDGNKTNNHISNLEWCTHAENMRHSWEMRRRLPPAGAPGGGNDAAP